MAHFRSPRCPQLFSLAIDTVDTVFAGTQLILAEVLTTLAETSATRVLGNGKTPLCYQCMEKPVLDALRNQVIGSPDMQVGDYNDVTIFSDCEQLCSCCSVC